MVFNSVMDAQGQPQLYLYSTFIQLQGETMKNCEEFMLLYAGYGHYCIQICVVYSPSKKSSYTFKGMWVNKSMVSQYDFIHALWNIHYEYIYVQLLLDVTILVMPIQGNMLLHLK